MHTVPGEYKQLPVVLLFAFYSVARSKNYSTCYVSRIVDCRYPTAVQTAERFNCTTTSEVRVLSAYEDVLLVNTS